MKLNLSQVETRQDSPEVSGPMVWSPQQEEVFDAVQMTKDSLRVDAVAGAGKTTTLVHGSKLMQGRVAFCAFNKRIADEIKSRVVSSSHITCGTLHSFGLRAWKKSAPDCQVDGDKLQNLADDLNVPFNLSSFTRFMVSMAKQHGYTAPVAYADLQTIADHFDAMEKLPESLSENADPFEHVNRLLRASVDASYDTIDFDDMLYMPLCYGNIEAEYDWVLIDEAQDTNRTRRHLVAALVKDTGRVCAVGDPHQAIYGFTGADADALDLIAETFNCRHLPLTVTYRCPKAVVNFARQWVSHIEAAPEAPEGVVRDLSAEDFNDLLDRGDSRAKADAFTARDVILCRNTRPLVSLALRMIRKGIGCRVEGRDIGQSLLTLANRWRTVSTPSKLIDKLYEYSERETRKLLARCQKAKAAQIEDKVSSLVAVIDSLGPDANLPALRNRITTLFGDTEPGQAPRVTTLSTVHKAKGREWDRVYLLGREALMPSRYAKQEWELQQERNLIYVAATRAKRELVEVEYAG